MVYEEKETPDMKPLPYSFFYDCLKENADYIHLAGFSWEMTPAIAEELKIRIKNKINETDSSVQSTHIGLRSVEKMMSLLNGQMLYSEQKQEFAIQLTFFSGCNK